MHPALVVAVFLRSLLRRVAAGDDAERDQAVRDVERRADVRDVGLVRGDAAPDGAEAEGIGFQKDVLGRGGQILVGKRQRAAVPPDAGNEREGRPLCGRRVFRRGRDRCLLLLLQ